MSLEVSLFPESRHLFLEAMIKNPNSVHFLYFICTAAKVCRDYSVPYLLDADKRQALHAKCSKCVEQRLQFPILWL